MPNADWATAASDASTTYTNPAGLVNIDRQQVVIAALGLKGHTRFTGSTQTPPSHKDITLKEIGPGQVLSGLLASIKAAHISRESIKNASV